MLKTELYRPKPKQAWVDTVDTPRQLDLHRKYIMGKHTTFVQEINIRNYMSEGIVAGNDMFNDKKKRGCVIL